MWQYCCFLCWDLEICLKQLRHTFTVYTVIHPWEMGRDKYTGCRIWILLHKCLILSVTKDDCHQCGKDFASWMLLVEITGVRDCCQRPCRLGADQGSLTYNSICSTGSWSHWNRELGEDPSCRSLWIMSKLASSSLSIHGDTCCCSWVGGVILYLQTNQVGLV